MSLQLALQPASPIWFIRGSPNWITLQVSLIHESGPLESDSLNAHGGYGMMAASAYARRVASVELHDIVWVGHS